MTEMRAQRSIHTDRGRAESFGGVAAEYDRYRPGYPAELIDDLLARCSTATPRVLDVGCGTGKAARMFAERGASVLGVEIDANMAELARAHGIEVDLARFEDWDRRGRRFDLIACAQAWHWINPQTGAPKLRAALADGGFAALFWNFDEVDEPTRTVIAEVYRAHAPELIRPPDTGDDGSHRAVLRASGVFGHVRTETYRWHRAVPAREWVAKVGTHSDHLLLGAQRLRQLQAALRAALVGTVSAHSDHPAVPTTGGTYVILLEP